MKNFLKSKVNNAIMVITALFFMYSCAKKNTLENDLKTNNTDTHLETKTSAVLQVFPDNGYQVVNIMGTDTKLNVAKFLSASNPATLATYLFNDLHLDVLRIPIFPPLQEPSDGVSDYSCYDSLLTVMNYAKTANPNLTFFASPAETAGEYPAWLGTGTSFNNRRYGKLIANYINYMHGKGYAIKYLGPYNEDGDRTPADFHWCTVGISDSLAAGITKPLIVGPDRYSIKASADFATSLSTSSYISDFTILGSHFYDDAFSSTTDNTAYWTNFVNTAQSISKNSWATEATRYGKAAGIDGLIDGINQMWDPFKAGINGVIVYQGVNQLIKVNAGVITRDLDYYGFKEFANNVKGKTRVGTSGTSSIRLLAFKNGTNLTVVALNTSTTSFNAANFTLNGHNITSSTVNQKYWTATTPDTGTSVSISASGTSFTSDVPARSYNVYTLNIN